MATQNPDNSAMELEDQSAMSVDVKRVTGKWSKANAFPSEAQQTQEATGKRLKPTFTWRMAYEATIETGKEEHQGTQRINLSYGYEKNVLKKTIVNIRRYTAAGRATTDGLFFDAEELDFLRENIELAAEHPREFKIKQQFSDRIVIVRNKRVHDPDHVVPEHGDQIDGQYCKTVVVVGFRKNEFTMARQLELPTVARLKEELDNIRFILDQNAKQPGDLFNHIFGVLVLSNIEPDSTKWGLVAETLLADDDEMMKICEDEFDFNGFELRQQLARNCKAFNIDMATYLNNHFNCKVAYETLRMCLVDGSYQDKQSVQMLTKIAKKAK